MMVSLYKALLSLGVIFSPVLLLLLRLCWGSLFIQAGYDKLEHIQDIVSYFHSIHVPAPTFMAYFVALVEFMGGALLFIGLGTRLISMTLAAIMIAALFYGHEVKPADFIFNLSRLVGETPVTYLIASIVLFAFGPGLFSIDALLKRFLFKNK